MHYLFGGSILRRRFRRTRWLSVAALAGAAVMLGSASAAVAATGWTVETIPQTGNNTILLGASARTSTDAWAVGQQFAGAGQAPPPPVSYHWNGTAWSLVPTPTLGRELRAARGQREHRDRRLGGGVQPARTARLRHADGALERNGVVGELLAGRHRRGRGAHRGDGP
jgi:hypothetical protein